MFRNKRLNHLMVCNRLHIHSARTLNIRAFHNLSLNFAVTNWITSAVTERDGRIRNRDIRGCWHKLLGTGNTSTRATVISRGRMTSPTGTAKLTQLYWVVQCQTRQTMYVEHNTEVRSFHQFCCGQATSIKIFLVFLCILALVMWHAKRMRHIILISGVCPALPYFSTLSHKRHDFREKKILNLKCVFWYSLNFFVKNFSFLEQFSNVQCTQLCKAPIILLRFWLYLNYLDRFNKNPHISNFMKIHRVGAEFFHADRRTDIHEKS